jgi:hypothetical protein
MKTEVNIPEVVEIFKTLLASQLVFSSDYRDLSMRKNYGHLNV